jgi:hypothetical protein
MIVIGEEVLIINHLRYEADIASRENEFHSLHVLYKEHNGIDYHGYFHS